MRPGPEKKKGLFADYMNKFLKVKMKVAGWPSRCDIEEKKRYFIQGVKQKEDVDLDPNMMKTTRPEEYRHVDVVLILGQIGLEG